MTGLEALQSVQYITVEGRRMAILDIEDWEVLIEWLENLEDIQIAQEALAQLEAAGGDRHKAGWLQWDDVKNELA